MTRSIGIGLILFFQLVISVVGKSQQLPDSTIALLKAAIPGFQLRYHSPGVVVAIVHGSDIVFSESVGYIDIENKVPATMDSKYPILSVTKTFTATMLMQLVQQGNLKLEDDVKQYLPELRADPKVATKSGITFLQLATHTSGLPRNTPADVNFAKQIDRWLLTRSGFPSLESATKKELLQSLKYIDKEYPDYELLSYGDRHYSNLGYSMLGIALERAAKQDFESYVVNNICKPLKMTNTGIGTENFGKEVVAKGYYWDDSLQAFLKTPVFHSNSALYAGGMYSTGTDLAKWISFQFDASAASDKILSQKKRAMMQFFRIGWKPSYPYVLHEGAMLGYHCQVIFNPELKIGWVILTNAADFEFNRMNEYISKLIEPIYGKKSPSLDQFVGMYRLQGGYDSLRIYLKDGQLFSTYMESELPSKPMVRSGNYRFNAQGRGSYTLGYEFVLKDNAEVKALNLGQLMWVKE